MSQGANEALIVRCIKISYKKYLHLDSLENGQNYKHVPNQEIVLAVKQVNAKTETKIVVNKSSKKPLNQITLHTIEKIVIFE